MGEGPSQELDDTALTVEAMYPIYLHNQISAHYNGSNSFLFANATKIYQLKAEHSEIKDYTVFR